MARALLKDGRTIEVKGIISRGKEARWMITDHKELGEVLIPMAKFGMWVG